MVPSPSWETELERWVAPFLERLGRSERRRWAPLYLKGLLLPGERKSLEPLAERVCPGDVQQLHHFLSSSPWSVAPLQEVLFEKADRLLGGREAVLLIDDTALVKQGVHSVGVARQYCGELGKKANCQCLVTLTLARAEVPLPIWMRLFLPESCREFASAVWGQTPSMGKRPSSDVLWRSGGCPMRSAFSRGRESTRPTW